jgi:hypothetical protein
VQLGLIPSVSFEELGIQSQDAHSYMQRFVSQELTKHIPSPPRFITFDGVDGVGKSTLATCLGVELSAELVHLDNFIEKNRGSYLHALKIEEIATAIRQASKKAPYIIMEGCFIEHVLLKIGQTADFRLYVARMTKMKADPAIERYEDYDLLTSDAPAHEIIAKRNEIAEGASRMLARFTGDDGNAEMPQLERELIQYHCDFRPQQRANVIVQRVHYN